MDQPVENVNNNYNKIKKKINNKKPLKKTTTKFNHKNIKKQ